MQCTPAVLFHLTACPFFRTYFHCLFLLIWQYLRLMRYISIDVELSRSVSCIRLSSVCSSLSCSHLVCPFPRTICRALPFPADFIFSDTHPHFFQLRSKMRSLALFERLLYINSSSEGRIGFLVITFPFDMFPHTQTGK